MSAMVVLALTGCAAKPVAFDYSKFESARPASLLVLPPVNESNEVKAMPSVWSHTTLPLAEAGYYVLPVTLVDQTLRENGITTPVDAQDIPLDKLRAYFGADAAVYIKVKRYGTTYAVLGSETRVDVEAKIVDLRTGETLWFGTAIASSAEQQSGQGGLAALLVTALLQQVIGTTTDASYQYAGIASQRMLGMTNVNGVLPGPRSPNYGKVRMP